MKIRKIRHRGLRRLIENDDSRELRGDLVKRIRNVLAFLVAASNIESLGAPPGWRVPPRRRPRRDLERFGFRQLAHHLHDRARRDHKPEPGGLSLMSSTVAKVGMKPPHPGAFIREEILEPHGLNISTGADVLGVRRATLSDLVNEKTSLSPEMALRIEKAFGVNMDTLLQMQAWHDARAMRDRWNEIRVKRYKAVAR
jgi:addiction module HigA family antidote